MKGIIPSPLYRLEKLIVISLLVLTAAIGSPASAANATINNPAVIDSWDVAQVQFEIWLVLFSLFFICFFHSLLSEKSIDITAIIALVISFTLTPLSMNIVFHSVKTIISGSSIVVQPATYVMHPVWLVLLMVGLDLVCIFNVWRAYSLTHAEKMKIRRGVRK